ncbi:MAG: holo-ACP synthase [Anaerolineae bacterium]
MKAIGVDIIEVARVARTIERFGERYLNRVFTEQELAYCGGRLPSLAVRWAAKEAVGKAFGTGIGDVAFKEIEVVCDGRSKPSLRLHGAAQTLARELGLENIQVSLSHTRDYAVAFVIAA